MQTLASDKFEGRLTGSPGEKLAADYLISELKRMGAKPLPGMTDFRMPFTFTAGSKDGGSKLDRGRTRTTGVATSTARGNGVSRLSFSDNGATSGAVVFAGYGIVVPNSQDFGYDSYQGLDVKDKIVVVLRYFPEDADQKTRAILARYADLRYKAQAARQRGAKGMIVVTGPRSPNAGERRADEFRYRDRRLRHRGGQHRRRQRGGADFRGRRQAARSRAEGARQRQPARRRIRDSECPPSRSTTKIIREQQTGNNVVAYLPATTPTTGVVKPWVAVGAHYDHLGRGGAGNSLADKAEMNQIHHGADDNASGTATVLNIADALAKQPRKRNLLIGILVG